MSGCRNEGLGIGKERSMAGSRDIVHGQGLGQEGRVEERRMGYGKGG